MIKKILVAATLACTIYLGYLQTVVLELEPEGARLGVIFSELQMKYGKCRNPYEYNCPKKIVDFYEHGHAGTIYRYKRAVEDRNEAVVAIIPALLGGWILALLIIRLYEARKASGPTKVEKLALRAGKSSRTVVSKAAHVVDIAQGRTLECGQCAELVKPNAKICRHCGSQLLA